MEEVTTIKVCEKCRRIRLTVLFLFIVSAVLAGVFWANVGASGDNTTLLWAIVFTGIAVVLILGVEIVVTRVELEAKSLYLQLKESVEEVRIQKEKVLELNRSLDLLAKDDDNLREQLLEERMRRRESELENKAPSP